MISGAFTIAADDAIAALQTDSEQGLPTGELFERVRRCGPNELVEALPPSVWKKLLSQFKDLVIWILVVAAIVSGALGEWVDALAILAIVLLNGVIGFFQEERAERALLALKNFSSPMAKVLRDGELRSVRAAELVPGDIIEIEAGDSIAADARLIRSFGFCAQEAALTGESVPVDKDAAVILDADTSLGERSNMVYMGTIATSGKARAVVTSTGMQSELGKIAGLLQRHIPEPTPLQRRLTELGRVLIVVCLIIVVLIFVLQVVRDGHIAEAFMLSVSLSVAAVPEGLPAVVTIALALGVQRMVRRNALVRKLPSVETLGCVTVVCSDKTGTLTRNEMTVQEVHVGSSRFRVSGSGYAPRGDFYCVMEGGSVAQNATKQSEEWAINSSKQPDLELALNVGKYCNNARLTPVGNTAQTWQVLGDPTEGALLVAAMKAGIDVGKGSQAVLYEMPFDSVRKAMSVIVRNEVGRGTTMYTKGAPETILGKCAFEFRNNRVQPLSSEKRQQWMEINAEMATRALRVLALAYRENPPLPQDGDAESDLVFAGLVGMIDPPREEARIAVGQCREAGIRPVMITGDHPKTALAVGRALGIVGTMDIAVSGSEMDAMTDEELTSEVDRIAVYARTSAEHKLRIVKAWKNRGEVVAMTGDGVNDAPAIKAADIGIAMGITGTDVTKEASDMVLIDDNFASIVSAVEEGRGIFDNIRKVLQFLLSCNLGEILLMLVASLLGWPPPLLPVQLLWINLVTDGLPALALSLESPEPDLMRRRPRRSSESILSPQLGFSIMLQGVLVGAAGLIAFGFFFNRHGDAERARAATFCVLVYAELLRALAARSTTRTLFQIGLFSNPFLLLAIAVSGMLQVSIAVIPFTRQVFDVPAHTSAEWQTIAVLALTPVTLIELSKVIRHRLGADQTNSHAR